MFVNEAETNHSWLSATPETASHGETAGKNSLAGAAVTTAVNVPRAGTLTHTTANNGSSQPSMMRHSTVVENGDAKSKIEPLQL